MKGEYMPEHKPTLPGSYKWAQNAPNGSRAAGTSKNYGKWAKNRNIIGDTYFLRVLCMQAHHLNLAESF